MKISSKEVEHIALLARLKLTEEEKELFSEQLSKILDYIEKLNELDTKDVEPTSHVIPLRNVFREDHPAQSLSVDDALKNAPERSGSFYRVPKIIE